MINSLKIKGFEGEIKQLPPMYSAVHHNGKRLYKLAREGKTVERKYRDVVINKLEVLDYSHSENPVLKLKVVCSKGTYIRVLAHDLGKVLGCGAHLVKLERTRSGRFHLDSSIDGKLLYDEEVDGEVVVKALSTTI